MSKAYHVAIVGATGAVGIEIMDVMRRRNFPVRELTLLASTRSAGKTLTHDGIAHTIKELRADSFAGVDLAFFSAGGSISREFAPLAVKAGAVVVDNSSCFRMDPDVPLVVPEVNGEDVRLHKGIIANPNCSTAITLMALYPLHKAFGVKRIVASTYQAVSGSGAKAIDELKSQVDAITHGRAPQAEVYAPYQIAFNAIPQVDVFQENGFTKEEMKMLHEGRKIMHHASFQASVTCVRIPVYRAHSISVCAEFERPVDLAQARAVLANATGLKLVDDPLARVFPTPLQVAGQDDCQVGRVRMDTVFENGLSFWVVGDQLLKGAALNAVQIAELL